MNRYSSLGAEMVVAKGKVRFSAINIVLRPMATFIYNYFFRLGFLDGREGLLLHLYHAVYVSWKYAKAWELSRKQIRDVELVRTRSRSLLHLRVSPVAIAALLLRAHFPIIKVEHWGPHGKEAAEAASRRESDRRCF